MNKVIRKKIIIFAFFQLFLLLNNTFALGKALSSCVQKSYLSPEVQLQDNQFQSVFQAHKLHLQNSANLLYPFLDIREHSPVSIFLDELGVEPRIRRSVPGQKIPIIIKNTKLLTENFNFDKNDYRAMLLVTHRYPVGIYIESGYYPLRYFIDISELLFLDEAQEQKEAIKREIKILKQQIESTIYSRQMPITKSVEVYSFEEGDIPVVFNIHPPNDLPSTKLISKTKQNINSQNIILDIGTGTGKIGAILAKSKGCRVVSTGISKTSLANARMTAAAFGISDKVEIIESDLFDALKGRKFDKIYFYPPTLKLKSLSVAGFMGVSDGEAEISPAETERLMDRLLSEFGTYLNDGGEMYLAVMASNHIAYEKIDKLEEEGKITKEIIYTYFEERGAKSFEILALKPVKDADKFKNYMKQVIIDKGGKIPFAEFMEDALYSEHGFFTNSVGIGRNKHFTTYAEYLPFAHSLAKQLVEIWEKMGKPGKFNIVEMGAGSGTLAKNIILYIQQNEPRFFNSLDYVIVEISPKLAIEQRQTLTQAFGGDENVPVRWIKGTAFDLSNLQDIEGVFLSNEMPDNFPVHRIKKINGRIVEIYTAFRDGKFVDEPGPLSSPELTEYVENLDVELKEGVEVPVNLNLRIWQENIAKALKRGFVITIDYGGKIEEISDQPFAVWNRETNAIQKTDEKIKYIYDNSGSCDITANVNFFDLAAWGKAAGLNVNGYILQRDFLWNLRFDEIIDELLEQGVEVPGSRSIDADVATNFHFKVLIQSKNIDAEIPLEGLRHVEPFYYLYNQATNLVLPVTPQDSSFLVCTNDRSNITSELIAKGKQAVKDYLSIFRSYPGEYTRIIEAGESNLRDGVYVLQLFRQELEDIRIYNDQGDILFDSRQFFERKGASRGLGIAYQDFEQRYLTWLDLSWMSLDPIPNFFYLHKDGLIRTFPQDFSPLKVIKSRTLHNETTRNFIKKSI